MVREQRRDANAASRAAQAMQLRILGHTFDTIAKQCGYHDRGAAYHAVQRELKRTVQQPADELRTLEVERLDALLRTFLPKALKGDTWSADRVLALMERRAKLLGLDAPPPERDIAQPLIVREVYPSAWVDGLARPTAVSAPEGGNDGE